MDDDPVRPLAYRVKYAMSLVATISLYVGTCYGAYWLFKNLLLG